MKPHQRPEPVRHQEPCGHTGSQAVHRWVVFGDNTIFLSHLSMFSMPEHAIQVVVEAEFLEPDGSPSTTYRDDRKAHPGQKLYTLDPSAFVLADLLPTDSTSPRRTMLHADLYRDQVGKDSPERALIASGIDVRVRRVVHAHRYDAKLPPVTELEYFVVGKGEETYLVHYITHPPDFDQIIGLAIDHELSNERLASGPRLTVPVRANTLDDRLQQGAATMLAILYTADGEIPVNVRPGTEFYCNVDCGMQ